MARPREAVGSRTLICRKADSGFGCRWSYLGDLMGDATMAADEMRLACRAYRAPDARTSQDARSGRQTLTTGIADGGTRKPSATPAGAANAMRLAPRRRASRAPEARAFHNMRESASRL